MHCLPAPSEFSVWISVWILFFRTAVDETVFFQSKNLRTVDKRATKFCTQCFRNADIHRKRLFLKQNFNKFWFLSKVRAIWHHTETWVLSLGRPEFRRKFNLEFKQKLSILANCRKYVDSACSFEKLQFDRKIFRSRVRRALTAASRYHPQFAFEAANCRWKWQNYFGNLEWQFVSKFDVQETPYGYKPKFAPRLIIQICARSALSLITWLLYFFLKGEGESKINGRWSPREIVRI